MKNNITLEIDYLKNVNPAVLLPDTPVINSVVLKNNSLQSLYNLTIKIFGEWLISQKESLQILPAKKSVSTEHLNIVFNDEKVNAFNEAVNTTFTIEVWTDEEKIFQETFPLRILPKDYWAGAYAHPESLACFVTPNGAGVAHVLQNAGKWMEKFTRNSALDGYQTKDIVRVRYQVAAIFEALREEGIIYSTSPASFEKEGQRVRIAEKVLQDKIGTSLDTTLLYASCLEQCGLNPILIIVSKHAFVGCWLEDTHSVQAIGDDVSYLSKNSANGISRLILVETTAITSSKQISFDEAVILAERGLVVEAALYIDVRQCRKEGYLPVSAKDGQWQNQGLRHKTDSRKPTGKMVQVDIKQVPNAPISREQIWERKLLDISLRNNLINLKLGRRALPFFTFNIEKIEDYLQDGKDYQIMPTPFDIHIGPNGQGFYDSREYKADYEIQILEKIRHGALTSYQTGSELAHNLKFLYRESRNSLEENGANTLFLALGFLKWFETEKSTQPRYAPILLLPVNIIRRSNTKYVIRTREEDITLNTALCEMLKQNFRITLPGLDPLPQDDNGCDVIKVLGIVRNVIMSMPHWDVLEEAVLGLFSFSKFVMWNDVHNNIDIMRQNPVIKALLEKGTWQEQEQAVDVGDFDKTTRPSDNAVPIDVDSSQLEAVLESGQGHSFILYGPPGTGKSQTITNMIANALYHGKKVLFVAEKKAALEVVQRRLERIGLAPFCLELHSNKVTRTHFLNQLETSLNVTRIQEPEAYQETAEDLFKQRQKLLRFNDLMHQPSECGLSLYDCIVRYTSLKGTVIMPSHEFMEHFSEKNLAWTDLFARQLSKLVATIGTPKHHPLHGLDIVSFSGQTKELLSHKLPVLSNCIQDVQKAIDCLNRTLCLSLPKSITSAKWTYAFFVLLNNWNFKFLFENDKKLQEEWDEANGKWFLPRYFAKKKFLQRLRQYNPSVTYDDIEEVLRSLSDFHTKAESLHITIFNGTPVALEENALQVDTRIILALRQFNDTLQQLQDSCTFNVGLEKMGKRIPVWCEHLDNLRDWSLWCNSVREAKNHHVQEILLPFEESDQANAEEVMTSFKKGCYQVLAQSIIEKQQELQMFKGVLFDEQIVRYKELDKKFKSLTINMLYYQLASKIPSQSVGVSDASELGILKRYIKSKGRGSSIRKIIDQIPNLLPRLCPVMLMSPLSVAQFLDIKQQKFDIVCFDEASQMPTSEAVGAIARGSALICVGDPKQMPPTSFFSSNTVDEEDAENDDMDSILDDCITISLPERYLNWHYRSKHESLIAFSNQQYYEGNLFTFPSVDDRDKKVKFVHIDGVYDYGKTRSNKAEANAIVEEVIKRLKSDSNESIGIVAFSKVQQNLIEDILGDRLAKYPKLEAKAFQSEEPIFVKNLENVQGDERDIILFSVGYGPDKRGKVSMNFGPLNDEGGERRLNVAVSRARSEMMVFSSMEPEMIDLNRTTAKGVVGLKNFLKFAKTGELPIRNGQQDRKANDIVEDIASELQKAGYQVDTHVGRSAFKMDLAVVDPKQTDRYILGILCDGETFNHTKTEREKEIGQPSFLHHLGWNLMRVWSLDWYMDKKQVLQQIIEHISELSENPTQANSSSDANPAANAMLKKAISSSQTQQNQQEEPDNKSCALPYSAYSDAPKTHGKWNTQSLFENAHTLHLEDVFTKTVQKEQPITLGLLCKRVASLYKINIVTKKFYNSARELLKDLPVYEDDTDTNELTYWISKEDKKKFTSFRENGGRNIKEYPTVEIANAVRYVISQQIGIPKEDLIKSTSILLGYSHTGSLIQKRIGSVIKGLIASGELSMKGDKIIGTKS